MRPRIIALLLLSGIITAALMIFPNPIYTLGLICEMLKTGGVRSLMMTYHTIGNYSPLSSIIVGTIAVIVPTLKPIYYLQANTEYYSTTGIVYTFLGLGMGMVLLTLLSNCLQLMISSKYLESIQRFNLVLSGIALITALFYWLGILPLAIGLIGKNKWQMIIINLMCLCLWMIIHLSL